MEGKCFIPIPCNSILNMVHENINKICIPSEFIEQIYNCGQTGTQRGDSNSNHWKIYIGGKVLSTVHTTEVKAKPARGHAILLKIVDGS